MKLHGTMRIDNNRLLIGDVPVEQLRAEYGTPLYIIDQEHFVHKAKIFLDNFRSENLKPIFHMLQKLSAIYIF